MMGLSSTLLSCCLVLLTLPACYHVEADTSLLCTTTIGSNRVLDTEASTMVVLTAYQKDSLEECLAGCCNQEWKEDVEEPRGHCNLVTYYRNAGEGVNNCFMVMCKKCSFIEAEGFSFAWVHPPAHHPVPSNAAILPFIRHALPSMPFNLPSIQSQSDVDMPPWQLLKSAISWTKDDAGSSPLLQRERRSIEERADKAPINPEEKQDTAAEKPSATITTEKPTTSTEISSSSTQQALVIVDDNVTLPTESSGNSSSTSQHPKTVAGTTKKNDEPAPSSEQTTPGSQSNAEQGTTIPSGVKQGSTKGNSSANETVTNGTSPTEGGVTNPPDSGGTKGASTNAPTAPKTAKPEEGQASTKLKAKPDVKTTAATSTSPENKVEPSTTKLATEKVTTQKSEPPSKTTKKTPETSPSKKITEKPSTPKKPSVKPVKDEEGETVTDIMDVTEIIYDDTTLSAEKASSNHNKFTFHTNNFLLVLSLAIGVVLVIVVIFAVGRRWYEAYQRRHYNKVDYLINGS